ncbi:unnamed protein product, partial [Chrysoparadoxa australica]
GNWLDGHTPYEKGKGGKGGAGGALSFLNCEKNIVYCTIHTVVGKNLLTRCIISGFARGPEGTMSEVPTPDEFQFQLQEDAAAKERAIGVIKRSVSSLGNISTREGGELGDEELKELLFQDVRVHGPQQQEFKRVLISGGSQEVDADTTLACEALRDALSARDRWLGYGPPRPVEGTRGGTTGKRAFNSPKASSRGSHFRRRPEPSYDPFAADEVTATHHTTHVDHGIYYARLPPSVEAAANGKPGQRVGSELPSVACFFTEVSKLMYTVNSGPVKSMSFQRLQLLEAKFGLHVILNGDAELAAQKAVPHRDFYNIRKVDTHVHHSACMNQKHLLRLFIKHKLKSSPNEVVSFRDGQFMTLSEVFTSLKLSAYDLSVDTLDMHASNTFHRFDRFNLKYNPAGQSRLREIFLKTDNLIAGQYLAEITKEVMADLSEAKYSMVEWRVSIYGRRLCEWDKLARWFFVNRLSHPNVRWMIQIPRLYNVYKTLGEVVETFQEMLDRIFSPLFEVTVNPEANLPLHAFLKTVVGFDSVDDESKREAVQLHPDRLLPTPEQWDLPENPPYNYWAYYLWANLTSLNALRASKGLNTIEFRPHCGEAGDVEHLAAAYLCADKINHGILLRKCPGLCYLYYLKQVGVALSPLSNNKLFLDYSKNPFPKYFAQGLNVSLSTDDPLMLHYTKDPLLEEYSVAAQVWKLSSSDQSEIARNSVLQSGFEDRFKQHYLGENYALGGAAGNDIRQSNVPDIRLSYRHETLTSELDFVLSGGG